MARISSGSSRSARGVEPVMSANIIVTTRLCSGAASLLLLPSSSDKEGALSLLAGCCAGSGFSLPRVDVDVNAGPHSIQNLAFVKFTTPQLGQTTSRFPHSRHNCALERLTA